MGLVTRDMHMRGFQFHKVMVFNSDATGPPGNRRDVTYE